MLRSLLHVILLALLVLSGPVQGLLAAAAPPATCCCGGEGGGTGPCGMPKGPCAPRCPQSGASQGIQAPATQAPRVRAAQTRKAPARKEPAPWPAAFRLATVRPAFQAATPAHGPPLPRTADPQAELRQFRI